MHGAILAVATAMTRLALATPDRAAGWAQAGDIYLGRGEHVRALGAYQRGLDVNPASADAHLGMEVALTQMGRNDEAREHYQRAIELRPDPRAYNNLATWYQVRGNDAEAERLYANAVALKPHWATPHDNLGIIYARRGDHARAVGEFESALRSNPEDWKAHTNLGFALRALGREAEARRHWETALALQPSAEAARNALIAP